MSPGLNELMTELRMGCYTESGQQLAMMASWMGRAGPRLALMMMGFITLCALVPAISGQVKAIEGENITLSCSNTSIIEVENGSIFWTFHFTSSKPITIYNTRGTERRPWLHDYDQRASILDQNGQLTIRNVSVHDSGIYTCSLRQRQQIDVKWDVGIHALPSPVIVNPTSPTVENKRLEFKCEVTVPSSVIRDNIRLTWNLQTVPQINTLAKTHPEDNVNEEVRESSILKANLTRSSNGQDLKCIASFTTHNGVNKNVSKRVALNISYTYNTRVDINANAIEEGGNGTLKCTNTSDANPDIKEGYRWFLNGATLDLPDANDVLMLDSVSSNHAGNYSCQIKSPAGWTRDRHAKAGIISLAPGRKLPMAWSIMAAMIVLAILVILLGITFVVYFCWRRRAVKQGHVNHRDAPAAGQHQDTYEDIGDEAAPMHSYARQPGNMHLGLVNDDCDQSNEMDSASAYAEVQPRNGPTFRDEYSEHAQANSSRPIPTYAEVNKKRDPKLANLNSSNGTPASPFAEYAEIQPLDKQVTYAELNLPSPDDDGIIRGRDEQIQYADVNLGISKPKPNEALYSNA